MYMNFGVRMIGEDCICGEFGMLILGGKVLC